MKLFLTAFISIFSVLGVAHAQSDLAKYGNDFLSTGAGARALGMGSAHAAIANDVTAGYWNVAGLADVTKTQIAYMHSERFDGIVGYDYAAIALPLQSSKGIVSISFFRQGVDNIANTLNAFDPVRNLPKENAEAFITRFSAADMGLFFSFAKKQSDKLSYGATAKVVHQRLGPFANAWGYSLDVGAKLKTDFADYGVSVQDLTTMQKMWEVDASQFLNFEDIFGDTPPTGQNEYVLPSIKLGAAKSFNFSDFDLIAATDIDFLFENRQAYYINLGRMSIEPHVGTELTYKKIISFRTGITDFVTDPVDGFSVSPTLGFGLKLAMFNLDYGFASFAGASSSLGFTHRISLRFNLDRLK